MNLEKIERISNDVLTILWDDGHLSLYFIKNLRNQCRCSQCQAERENYNPLKILDKDPDDIELTGWNFIGRYAISFKWSDEHDTEIFTYERLRQICQCDECDFE